MKYPIGIQSFEKIRTGGYVYVDKTDLINKLVQEGSAYFLSRPRRFGKSLLLSTLKSYFEGDRDLFNGLAISSLEKEWKSYTVFSVDLNSGKYTTSDSLVERIDNHLSNWEKQYGIIPKQSQSLSSRFENLIALASELSGNKVVILVDEYDKPLLEAIGNPELQDDFRKTLKSFYGVIKSMDAYIRFAFITGVTKFSKVSIFSDLNSLEDISMVGDYSSICGITEAEIHDNFDEEVGMMAAANDMTKEACYERLQKKYDGYHFKAGCEGVYNPYSLLTALKQRCFGDFWFSTGTPLFLAEVLQHTDFPLDCLTTEEVDARTLDSVDMMYSNPIPLLFQSGYLTIKAYDAKFGTYCLGFPNEEVEQGFAQFMGVYYFGGSSNGNFIINNFVREVECGDVNGFMMRLQSLFADGDYQVTGKLEVYFQNTLQTVFKLMGFYTQVERHTSQGRMDVTIQTRDYIYIMELKVDKSADDALRQIEDKQYALPFVADPRKLFKIGVRFSSKTRGIDEWKIDK